VVVARPEVLQRSAGQRSLAPRNAGVSDGDARRLTGRARTKDALLVLFGQQAEAWPTVQLRLAAEPGGWTGIGNGYGRLVRRRLTVAADRKAQEFTRDRAIAGTPEDCIRQIAAWRDRCGADAMLFLLNEELPVDGLVDTVRLFGREVFPTFTDQSRQSS